MGRVEKYRAASRKQGKVMGRKVNNNETSLLYKVWCTVAYCEIHVPFNCWQTDWHAVYICFLWLFSLKRYFSELRTQFPWRWEVLWFIVSSNCTASSIQMCHSRGLIDRFCPGFCLSGKVEIWAWCDFHAISMLYAVWEDSRQYEQKILETFFF